MHSTDLWRQNTVPLMYRHHLVGNRYFVLFVFYTKSVMLGPRFIPESIFYTQSVMLSPRFIPECVFCFVLTFPALQYQICFFYTFSILKIKKRKAFSVESLYHNDSNMFRRFNKVKPCSARLLLGWVTKYKYSVLQ